jgi:transposase
VALASQKRGPKINPALAEARRFEQLTRENQRLQSQLDKAMLVIDVQKKVSRLLGLSLPANALENT